MHASTRAFLTGLCLVILAGCGISKPSRFYILTPVEGTPATTVATPGPAVGIGPITFPVYLDRPEIVHRSSDNQVHYAGADRWAEPLKATFKRTLAENLSVLLPTERVIIHPWPRDSEIDFQLILHVTRFDADASGTVILATNWEIVRAEDRIVVTRQKAVYNEAVGSMAYPAIVAAQSRAVESLGRDISAAINRAGMTTGESVADMP